MTPSTKHYINVVVAVAKEIQLVNGPRFQVVVTLKFRNMHFGWIPTRMLYFLTSIFEKVKVPSIFYQSSIIYLLIYLHPNILNIAIGIILYYTVHTLYISK